MKRFPSKNKTQSRNQNFTQPRNSSQGSGDKQAISPGKSRVTCGIHSVNEALKVRPKKVEKVLLRQGWESSAELRDLEKLAQRAHVKIELLSELQLDRMSSRNQGVAAFVSEQPQFDWNRLESSTHSVILGLDGLEDPHNFGAIVRTSWLLGVDGILHTEDRSVGLTATVNKIACGGVEHVPLESVNNFSNSIEKLKKSGYWVFGLAAGGSSNIYNIKIPEKVLWMVGSEGKGLRKTSEKLCDELVSIPQVDALASFNASVAAGITLGETYRQHQSQKK